MKQDATCFYNSTTTQKRCGNKRNQLNNKYSYILIYFYIIFNCFKKTKIRREFIYSCFMYHIIMPLFQRL
ncbi:hypothetical protein CON32_18155 [Bacillus cereus]|nr:hypothetical protein CON32_18155 [Bacillus cereus]